MIQNGERGGRTERADLNDCHAVLCEVREYLQTIKNWTGTTHGLLKGVIDAVKAQTAYLQEEREDPLLQTSQRIVALVESIHRDVKEQTNRPKDVPALSSPSSLSPRREIGDWTFSTWIAGFLFGLFLGGVLTAVSFALARAFFPGGR